MKCVSSRKIFGGALKQLANKSRQTVALAKRFLINAGKQYSVNELKTQPMCGQYLILKFYLHEKLVQVITKFEVFLSISRI